MLYFTNGKYLFKKYITEQVDSLNPEIQGLIDDLYGDDYTTDQFSDIGVNSLVIRRTVFRADKSYLGGYFARKLYAKKELVTDRTVLDLGCGCGLLGLICGLHGARSVHFSDVNPEAVKNSKLNALLVGVDNVNFSTGSLFEGLPDGSKFGVIVFNPPSITGVPRNLADAAFIREDRLLLDFYNQFPNYLEKDGTLIMPGSSRFQSQLSPLEAAQNYGWKYAVVSRDNEEGGHYKYILSVKSNEL